MERLRIILAGPGAVGKTTFLRFIRTGEFDEHTPYTVGAEESILKQLYEGKEYLLRVIDIGGQIQFSYMRKDYYSEADGAILMFSLSFPKTLNDLKTLYKEVIDECGNIPMIITGNKSDRWDNNNFLEKNIISTIQELRKNAPICFISVKTGQNADLVFPKLLEFF
ncbi:hypothetical protein ES705_07236 [subsurface metagenome]